MTQTALPAAGSGESAFSKSKLGLAEVTGAVGETLRMLHL